MTLQQKLDDLKAKFESGGPPRNAPKAIIEAFHRATEGAAPIRIGRARSEGWRPRAGIRPEQSGRKLGFFRGPPCQRPTGNYFFSWSLVTLLHYRAGGSTNSFALYTAVSI